MNRNIKHYLREALQNSMLHFSAQNHNLQIALLHQQIRAMEQKDQALQNSMSHINWLISELDKQDNYEQF